MVRNPRGTVATVRREARPANEQRPPGNPEEQNEGPRKVVAYMGEIVESGDHQTTAADMEVGDRNTPREDGRLECPSCDKNYKNQESLDRHLENQHDTKPTTSMSDAADSDVLARTGDSKNTTKAEDEAQVEAEDAVAIERAENQVEKGSKEAKDSAKERIAEEKRVAEDAKSE